jgi:DDE superfamily endonuclease
MRRVWGRRLRRGAGHLPFHLSARHGEDAFLTVLDHLAHDLPADEPVVVVLDNGGSHTRHALRERWRQQGDRFQPFFLPAYSPPRTRMERLWRLLKDKLACHRWWTDRARLQQATETVLAGLEVHFPANDVTDRPIFRLVHTVCDSA